MTNEDAVKWIKNLKDDIGTHHNASLWHYEQALSEIEELLKEQEARIRELEEKLRLLEYGDQDTLESAMMQAT